MIISRTPFRISFFGGGTDYPAWYRQHGGSVLAATIDKFCYLTCRYLPPFFEHRLRVVYRKIETCQSAAEVRHPAVREVLKYLRFERGLELHHDGDLPARSGMGSSSAFTVGLLNALHALRGAMPGPMQLTRESLHIEQQVLGETVGSQDQVMAAHGGLRHVRFFPDGRILAQPVPLSRQRLDELQNHLMLFYTGIVRTASDVAQSYVARLDTCKRQLQVMRELVAESLDILGSGTDLAAFGDLLHEAWQMKRSLSPQVSSAAIDALYERARSAGGLGGKLTGAGGGGFLLLFVPPERRPAVLEALDRQIHVPFTFEPAGSQIIFCDPGVDYRQAELERAHRQRSAVAVQEILMDRSARIYVAGGDTLIGVALLDQLREAGYEHLTATPPDEPDLTQAHEVDDFFAQAQPEYVFLAAGDSGGIGANLARPADLMLHNLLVATHVIQAAHVYGIKKLLYLGSSCSYPRCAPQPLRVESLMSGMLEPTSEGYATAKLAGLKLCQAYRRQYGSPFISAISANAFGLHDDFCPATAHVLPALLGRLHEAKVRDERRVVLWGTGSPRREFLYAGDLAEACVHVMLHYDEPAPINLGGGTVLTIAAAARLVAEVVDYRGQLVFDSTRPDGAPVKVLDAGPLAALGWRPRTPFRTALEQTYDWFVRHGLKEEPTDVPAIV